MSEKNLLLLSLCVLVKDAFMDSRNTRAPGQGKIRKNRNNGSQLEGVELMVYSSEAVHFTFVLTIKHSHLDFKNLVFLKLEGILSF